MPMITALGRLRQEDGCQSKGSLSEFQDSLDCIAKYFLKKKEHHTIRYNFIPTRHTPKRRVIG